MAHSHRICSSLIVTLLGVSVPRVAFGQAGAGDPTANRRVGQVMASLYRQGAVEDAEAQLLGTLSSCGEQCTPAMKARIWMYVGIVRADGRRNPGLGKQAFVSAARLDPAVQLDATYASPQTAALFKTTVGTSDPPASPPPPAITVPPAGSVVTQPPAVGTAAQPAPLPATECYPACREGFACNQGTCVSVCNPACDSGQTCTSGGQCIGTAFTPGAPGQADSGWARGAAITGFVVTPLVLGLGIASAATSEEQIPSIPLGATATVLMGAAVPIVAVGGASARHHPEVRGLPGLRIASWISYGLTMADAVVMLAFGVLEVDPGVGPILIATALGGTSIASMSIDALVSANQASRVAERQARSAPSWEVVPFLAPLAKTHVNGRGVACQGGMAGLYGRF